MLYAVAMAAADAADARSLATNLPFTSIAKIFPFTVGEQCEPACGLLMAGTGCHVAFFAA